MTGASLRLGPGKNKKAKFVASTGIRHSILSNLKTADHRLNRCLPYFKCNNVIFDISKKTNRKTCLLSIRVHLVGILLQMIGIN